MRVEITLPKRFGYINLLYKTSCFFRLKHLGRLYADKAHGFYIFLEPKRVVIRMETADVYVKKKVEAYLESTFQNSYIGIPKELKNCFELQGVETYLI